MTTCPQCTSPIPRESSRFCNQCGADLSAYVEAREELSSENVPPVLIAPTTSPRATQPPDKNDMAQSQNNPLSPKPLATLHIVLRDGTVMERELMNQETRIGKGPHNDLILADGSVSGSHALISMDEKGFLLTDLESRNGTFLNDQRLTAPQPLRHGDLIKMGHCTLTFRVKESAATPAMPRTQILETEAPPPPPVPPPVPAIPPMTEESLGKAIVATGLLTAAELAQLTSGQRGLYRALLDEKKTTEVALRDLMSRVFQCPQADLQAAEIHGGMVNALGQDFMRRRLALPLGGKSADSLLVAVADPTDRAAIEEIEKKSRKKIVLRLATPSEILGQLDNHFAPRLIGVLPSGEKIEALLNQAEVEIGKAPHNRLVIADPTVSSTHAIILVRDGGYNIVDLGSSNGTFVNGQRLGNESHTLQHGDKIQLGHVVLTFRNPVETTENKTAKLSLEALEEIRRRAGLSGAQPAAPAPAVKTEEVKEKKEKKEKDKEKEKEKDKKKDGKKKEDDRIKAALVNSTSRILSTVLGAALTVAVAYYLTRPTQPAGGPSGSHSSGPAGRAAALSVAGSWEGFGTGLFGKKLEASGVAYKPGANGVLLVADSSQNEVLWMPLDEMGKQNGSLTKIPLGVNFRDPEALTYGNSFYYLLTSQSEPQDGNQNALVRFDFDPATQTLRGQAEMIPDLRNYLLSNVTEIATLGAPRGLDGGLNTEGIAWDPNNERLLLGLRSPLIGNQAVLIPLKLNDPRGPFQTGNLKIDEPRVIVLSLEGHGIRDLTYDPRLKNFLIISGAPETSPKTDFILWEWNGQADSKPVKLLSLEDKMKPEGISNVTINGRSFLFVAGDGGSYLKLAYEDAR